MVAVGGTAGKAHEPVGWELSYPLRKQYEAGNYAEVVPQLREVVAEAPQYGLLFTQSRRDAPPLLRQRVEPAFPHRATRQPQGRSRKS